MNQFMVGVRGDRIMLLRTTPLISGITKAEAIELAAWLVALADPDVGHNPDSLENAPMSQAFERKLQEVLAT